MEEKERGERQKDHRNDDEPAPVEQLDQPEW